ncbi:hypothetical protein B566_EDAN007666 [Ephemera danica]|nr:hypothetical protein B566_EDAN007666 [Ephemera danica]
MRIINLILLLQLCGILVIQIQAQHNLKKVNKTVKLTTRLPPVTIYPNFIQNVYIPSVDVKQQQQLWKVRMEIKMELNFGLPVNAVTFASGQMVA